MSKKRRNRQSVSASFVHRSGAQSKPPAARKMNWLMIFIIGFFCLGALGAGLKYLEDDARRQMPNGQQTADGKSNASWLNAVNPFLSSAPASQPTPQLAKEYVYAGGKLLAVEDAGANQSAPADLAVFRPSTGVWWILGGQGSQQFSQGWGTAGDAPVAAFYRR